MIKNIIVVLISFTLCCGAFYMFGHTEKVIAPKHGWPGSEIKNKTFEFSYNKQSMKNSYNEVMMRIIPQKRSFQKKHFILAGGSNTFGMNLHDKDTLLNQFLNEPYYLDYFFYNLSSSGWGPNHMLAYLEQFPFFETIQERNGVFIYFFFKGHFYRSCGGWHYLNWSKGSGPEYLNVDNKIKYIGPFSESYKYQIMMLVKGVSKVINYFFEAPNLLQQLQVEFEGISENCIDLNISLLKMIENKYRKKFPKGKFIVTLINEYHVPFHTNIESERLNHFLDKAEKSGLIVKSLQDEFIKEFKNKNISKDKLWLPDGHVNEVGHKIRVEQLKKIIKR